MKKNTHTHRQTQMHTHSHSHYIYIIYTPIYNIYLLAIYCQKHEENDTHTHTRREKCGGKKSPPKKERGKRENNDTHGPQKKRTPPPKRMTHNIIIIIYNMDLLLLGASIQNTHIYIYKTHTHTPPQRYI